MLMEKGFGDLFSESWNEYRRNFKLFFMLLLWLVFVPALIIFIIGMGLPDVSDVANPIDALKILFSSPFTYILAVLGFVKIILYLILSVSLIYFVFYNKRIKSYGEAIRGGMNYFWGYLGLNIVLVFLLFFLFLLLIIPGILFLVYWTFAFYILIGENKGIWESMKESKKLVRGRWWKVFGYALLFFLILAAISLVLSIPSIIVGLVTSKGNIFVSALSLITNWIISLLFTPLSVLFFKNFYLELKKGKAEKK